jgi:hypothetical protein
MVGQILEIFENCTDKIEHWDGKEEWVTRVLDQEKSAKEITTHVMEFIEWLTAFSNKHSQRCGIGWRIPNIDSQNPYKEYILNEVYNYWLTEVKNKEK